MNRMFSLALASALSVAIAGAQTATGNLRGYVTNGGAAAAAVPDAQVGLRAIDNNALRGTVTNASGFYYLGGLRPGRYELTVRRVGFAPQTRQVQIQIGQTVDFNVAIAEQVVQLSTVTVQESTVQGTTRTSEVGTNISQQQIADLPNFERNVLDLAKLVPGVTATSVNSTDKTFASGGQPASSVNVFVDGASFKSDILPGGVAGQNASKGNPFPQGAIQEFRVLTQNYKAEYQKAAAAVIVATTKSGTNALEASAFAYGIGHGYAARDAFAELKGFNHPQYQRLQAGASLGGPLVRDKLFFFGTYELNFRDEPSYVTLGGSASQAPPGVNFNQYLGQFQQQFREHLGIAKLTWNKSDRSTLDVSANIRHDHDFRDFGGQTTFQSATNLPISVNTGVATWKYAGDRYLNEAQVNGQVYNWAAKAINYTTIGQNYEGILRIGGNAAAQDFRQTRLSLRDDITRGGVRLAGDHVFKGGASLDFLDYRANKELAGNPVFSYRAAEKYLTPYQVVFGQGNPLITNGNQQIGAYVQDDWSAGRKLVLNLGLRWDVETNPINNAYVTPSRLADSLRGPLNAKLYTDQIVAAGGTRQVRVIDQLGGIDRFISTGRDSRPIKWNQFQPRLGASYDLMGDGRTVIFGGAGLYYDRTNWNTLLDEQFRRQYGQYNVQFRATCPAGQAGCTAWDPKYLDPAVLRTLAGTTGVPEIFLVANDLRAPQTTQMSAGIRQAIGGERVTLSYNGLRGRNYTNFVRASPFGGLGPNYLTAFVTDDRVKTWYDALQLQIERPMLATSRWGGSIAYTLGKSEEQGQSTDIFWGFDDRYPTVADRPRLRAPGDQRHAVVANAIVRLPADFQISGIATLASGITVNGTNASNGGDIRQQSTYTFTPPSRAFLGVGHVFANQNLDMRVEKDFTLANSNRVGVALDLFNAFNSANFGCYDTYIAPRTGAPNANYGRPGCAAPGRRLQIGLRYNLDPSMSGSASGSRTGSTGSTGGAADAGRFSASRSAR